MVDTPTPETVTVPTPVVATVESSPPAVTPVTASTTESTVEAPIQTKTEAVVEAPKTETVLATALDEKPKPVEAPKTETVAETPKVEEKKVEATKTEEPAPVVSPTYDAFKLPEGVTLDEGRVKAFTDMLGELETVGKTEHAFVQEFGQKAVDFHIQEVRKVAEDLTNLYKQTWEKQKISWKDAFLADPEIGGNKQVATVTAARDFIRTHGGTDQQQKEFRDVMESSGLGNHPAIIRLLANASRVMQEGKPLAATAPVSPPKSKVATMYGKNQ